MASGVVWPCKKAAVWHILRATPGGADEQLPPLGNEAETYAYGIKNVTLEQVAVKAHARKRQSGNVLDIVPERTPTEVVEHRLSKEKSASVVQSWRRLAKRCAGT